MSSAWATWAGRWVATVRCFWEPPTGKQVRAVAASSPALVKDSQDAAYDVWRLRDAYADIPLRIDIGRGDSFYRAVMDYEDGLPEPPAGSVTGVAHRLLAIVAPSSSGSPGARL